ncbi:MAG TPA: M64 family metallopeptidase, partial [Chthoniobacterales bacterium]
MSTRSRQTCLVLLCACLTFFQAGAALHAQTVAQIRESGPRSNRINVVILSEGYTSAELTTKFPADAQRIMDGFLASEPFREYRDYFNFFTIAVPSQESGSDHPSRGIARDTYFNSSYDTYGVPRMLTIPPNSFISSYAEGEGKVSNLLAQFVPDYDVAMLLVNDEEYGGTGGGTAIVSMNDMSTTTAIHEMGHSFAGLADEYDLETPGLFSTEGPNVTQQTNRDLIRWRSWILPSTPIPTPETIDPGTNKPHYGDVVGLFEGASYQRTGWYRPKFTCRMNTNISPFCEVCAETLTLNIYRRVSHLDAVTPQVRKVNIPLGQSATFTVTKLQPTTHSLSVQWFLDDVAVAGATGDSFTISDDGTGGYHNIRVDVWDPTPLVRVDPQHVLKRSERWELWIGPTAPGPAPVLNVSTRLAVQGGDGVLIGGFIITGSNPKRVIIRAIGPSMAPGIQQVSPPLVPIPFLADPTLELFNDSGAVLASNDNWKTT